MSKYNSAKGVNNQSANTDQGLENVLAAINNGAGATGDVLCLIWPRRPGCPGDPNRAPDTVIQNYSTGNSMMLIYLLIGVILIGIALYFLKGKK